MKVPLKWLKDYLDIDKSPQDIAQSFTAIGLMLDKPIENQVLDLEHRMDRSDWLSIIGCARDLAAYEKLPLKLPNIKTPKCKQATPETLVPIKVTTKAVKRFNTRVFRHIKVKPSPQWLKDRLESYGIPSKNNIVDITNFVMVELGQPLHAQDLQKFTRREIVIRDAKPNETIRTLHGDLVKLKPPAFVLTENDQPIVLGGIVGGQHTGVTHETTEIILDAGNYDQKVVRRASRLLKIQNETVLRYDKFLHPKLTEIALDRATQLILELAGGECYQNIDWYPNPVPPLTKTLRLSRFQTISGFTLPLKEIKRILTSLGYQIIAEDPTSLQVEIPYFRTDIQVEDDLVADILRIHGYRHIPTTFLSSTPPKEITSDFYRFRQQVKQIMLNLGFHQHITESLIEKTGKPGEVVLANALTSEKSALRTTLLETLRPLQTTYTKHQLNPIALFEIGLTFKQLKSQPQTVDDFQESFHLALIYQDQTISPEENSKRLRSYLARLFQTFSLQPIYRRQNNQVVIEINHHPIGSFDHQSAEIDLHTLFAHAKPQTPLSTQIPNYPREDFSLILPLHLDFGPLLTELQQLPHIHQAWVKEEYQDKTLAKNKQKAILLQVLYQSQATLTQARQTIIDFFTQHQLSLKQ